MAGKGKGRGDGYEKIISGLKYTLFCFTIISLVSARAKGFPLSIRIIIIIIIIILSAAKVRVYVCGPESERRCC